MKSYVVIGSTGEYSDHMEWLVAVFFSEEKAKELVVKATARANELYAGDMRNFSHIKDGQNEHDPHMQADYTGTQYSYEAVEVQDEPLSVGQPRAKLSRRQVMAALGKLQTLIGRAKSDYQNDRAPDRADRVEKSLDEAFEIAVNARD